MESKKWQKIQTSYPIHTRQCFHFIFLFLFSLLLLLIFFYSHWFPRAFCDWWTQHPAVTLLLWTIVWVSYNFWLMSWVFFNCEISTTLNWKYSSSFDQNGSYFHWLTGEINKSYICCHLCDTLNWLFLNVCWSENDLPEVDWTLTRTSLHQFLKCWFLFQPIHHLIPTQDIANNCQLFIIISFS